MLQVMSALFAKIESVYGTDPTPVAATDSLECYDKPSFDLVTAAKPRTVSIATFGELAPLIVGEAYKLSGVKLPLKGSGAAGTPPRIGCILRGMGFAQTISAGVSVAYALHSSFNTESFACYFWHNNKKHIMTGCVATGKISLVAGEKMFLEPEITGMYGGVIADVNFPAPTFETTPDLIWQNANFKQTIASVDSTPVISKLDIDLGAAVSKRTDPNGVYGINRYFVNDRKTKFSWDPEQDTLTNFNPYTLHQAQTAIALESKPTGISGNKIEIVSTGITLDAPKSGDRNNIATWDLSGMARPTVAAGNAELTLTFK